MAELYSETQPYRMRSSHEEQLERNLKEENICLGIPERAVWEDLPDVPSISDPSSIPDSSSISDSSTSSELDNKPRLVACRHWTSRRYDPGYVHDEESLRACAIKEIRVLSHAQLRTAPNILKLGGIHWSINGDVSANCFV